ncbi:Replicase polyprotein [Wickerhamomyces ciferrii]|uniref:Replicase polyprotein n=1 Tax=Wickerhamomyces ciferrii (strain ATCC 14091 / BCRC 22168 / CBS 111 / JCM 3599 / NBRC 0793 / NRRL Y-1031 F-60-10) TaxID=1206466 RepID=K0KE00_WICCF|nr:Replicase polyprotein [Wickerhamomyces ciferrii]CCH43315.1 Replicase polyprotein [Wickerhamomyces ciferrii]
MSSNPPPINWCDIHIGTLQNTNIYSDDIKRFKADYKSVTGLNAFDAGIGENPFLNNDLYPCKVSLYKGDPTNPREKASANFYSLLCPFCTTSYNSQKNKVETFFDISNGDYERHLREHHGVYTNDLKAPQPYIGNTLVFKDGGNGLPINEQRELTITCPHYLETYDGQACLASFSFDKDSKTPFAEYFNHFHQCHVLHEEEPSGTIRYRSTYRSGGDQGNRNLIRNYFIPLHLNLYLIAFRYYLENTNNYREIKPLLVPSWDDELFQEAMRISPNPSQIHPSVNLELTPLHKNLTSPSEDSDSDSDIESVFDDDDEQLELYEEAEEEIPEALDSPAPILDILGPHLDDFQFGDFQDFNGVGDIFGNLLNFGEVGDLPALVDDDDDADDVNDDADDDELGLLNHLEINQIHEVLGRRLGLRRNAFLNNINDIYMGDPLDPPLPEFVEEPQNEEVFGDYYDANLDFIENVEISDDEDDDEDDFEFLQDDYDDEVHFEFAEDDDNDDEDDDEDDFEFLQDDNYDDVHFDFSDDEDDDGAHFVVSEDDNDDDEDDDDYEFSEDEDDDEEDGDDEDFEFSKDDDDNEDDEDYEFSEDEDDDEDYEPLEDDLDDLNDILVKPIYPPPALINVIRETRKRT